MPILSLPNELLRPIANSLSEQDVFSLIMTNKLFAAIFTPVLHAIGKEDHEGLPGIHWAVKRGHLTLVRILLDEGVSVEEMKSKACTPLMSAAENGQKDIVRLLLQRGASIDARDDDGNTALIFATRGGRIAVCKLLLEYGATDDCTEFSRNYGFRPQSSALHWAVSTSYPNERLIDLMLDKGANLNDRDCMGATILHRAAVFQNYDVVKLILRRGIDVNAQDHQRNTALHRAVWNSRLVKLLIEYGANTEVHNSYGETVLRMAVFGRQESTVRVLIDAGADVNETDSSGNTLVGLASSYGPDSILEMLEDAVRAGKVSETAS